MIHPFDYRIPATLGEACDLLWEFREEGKIIAGGTDLVIGLRKGDLRPRCLIDITRIEECRYPPSANGAGCRRKDRVEGGRERDPSLSDLQPSVQNHPEALRNPGPGPFPQASFNNQEQFCQTGQERGDGYCQDERGRHCSIGKRSV